MNRRKTELIWRNASHKELFRELDTEDTYVPRERPWYKKALQAGELIWTNPYIFFTSQKPGITAASPVFLPSGKIKGIVGVIKELQETPSVLERTED